jgi:hypothetical protein
MSRTFTVTLGDDGTLDSVVATDGKGTVQQIPTPHPFAPGKTIAATGIGVVMTEENPACCYWIQGGRAFKVCW